MRRLLPFLLFLFAVSFLITAMGCAPASPADDLELVPAGKEDNFRSTTAGEFQATAEAQVVLDDADAQLDPDARLTKANELVSARLLQIGWFLNLWISDKEDSDANHAYGGFHAQARNASVKSLGVTPVDARTFSFNFEATIAAQNGFLSVLPGEAQPDGSKKVAFALARVSNDELLAGTWQGRYDVHTWSPANEPAEAVETLSLSVKVAPRSANAYLDYDRLYADGKLLVGAQFGWDYNTNRADLANARKLYDDLLAIGFTSPVGRYEDLTLDSPPLTRTSTVNGKTVQVEIKLVHPGMVADPAQNAVDLRNALLDLLATREVVLFNGHAGVSGRLLPADFRTTSAGNILPTEYPSLRLYDGLQLLLVEGCQTYARFTDGFRQNPAKRGRSGELVDMDIVTSTSYTWTSQGAFTMETILWPLVGRAATSNVHPATWDDILRTLNAPPNETAFFGVNGIDEDPHAHPYARTDLLGQGCTSLTDCGGEGNLCVPAGGQNVCASECLDDTGCPAGHRCATYTSKTTHAAIGACVAK